MLLENDIGSAPHIVLYIQECWMQRPRGSNQGEIPPDCTLMLSADLTHGSHVCAPPWIVDTAAFGKVYSHAGPDRDPDCFDLEAELTR